MKTYKIELTEDEYKIIGDLLLCQNLCSSGCYFEDMQNKNVDCDDCKFTKVLNLLWDKFEL